MTGTVLHAGFMLLKVVITKFAHGLAPSDVHPPIEEPRGIDTSVVFQPVQQQHLRVNMWFERVSAILGLDPVVKVIGLQGKHKIPKYLDLLFLPCHATHDAVGRLALVPDRFPNPFARWNEGYPWFAE